MSKRDENPSEEKFIIVTEFDTYNEKYGPRRGPLAFEVYLDGENGSLESAKKQVTVLGGRYGKCRIARLVFIDEEASMKPSSPARPEQQNCEGQFSPAPSGEKTGENSCLQTVGIASPAQGTEGSVAPVSPAISPAVNPESREKPITETRSEHQSGDQPGNGNTKPNCYECKHRGEVPGSAHSSCRHPAFSSALDHPLGQLLSIMGRRAGVNSAVSSDSVRVRGNSHGIRNGWFLHPFNFDPIWLEECSGFEKEAK